MISENIAILEKLHRPKGRVRVVLDTDTYNEIDDQYCLAYALLSPEKIQLEAVYAELFRNRKAATCQEGMEKSYQEILKVLRLMGREELSSRVFRGSCQMLPDRHTPVDSDAARDLIQRSRQGEQLYVAAIGALTNVASALLLDPSLKDRIVVVWLGNHLNGQPDNREFNYQQDPVAVQVVFDSGVPLVNIPAGGVTSHMTTSEPELRHWLKGRNPLCDYLYEITCQECREYGMGEAWAKEIWDVVTIAWLVSEEDWTTDVIMHVPVVTTENALCHSPARHLMRQVIQLRRNKIFEDLFSKLQKA